jgi:hypothetical protein
MKDERQSLPDVKFVSIGTLSAFRFFVFLRKKQSRPRFQDRDQFWCDVLSNNRLSCPSRCWQCLSSVWSISAPPSVTGGFTPSKSRDHGQRVHSPTEACRLCFAGLPTSAALYIPCPLGLGIGPPISGIQLAPVPITDLRPLGREIHSAAFATVCSRSFRPTWIACTARRTHHSWSCAD